MHSSFTNQSPSTLRDGAASTPEEGGSPEASRLGLSLAMLVGQATITLERVRDDKILSTRLLPHVAMVLVALLAISLSNLNLSWGNIKAIGPLTLSPAQPTDTASGPESLPLTLPTELGTTQGGVLVRRAVPQTTIPDRSTPLQEQSADQIGAYAVEAGDTISGIASKFGLSPETIVWSNPDLENNPDLLSVGQKLLILPVDGVYHQVGGGDTVEAIAGTFRTDPALILSHPLNELDPANPIIQLGQWLVVPGGSKPFVPRTVTSYSGPTPPNAIVGSGIFGWPASGEITQGFYGYHPGIDVAAWTGASVSSADAGFVLVAGWDNLYGYHVVVDHGNGFQTLYAHLQSYYVDAGQNVSKGHQIGEMGSTGNSTGPHLHFEIRQGTIQRNPYGFLP